MSRINSRVVVAISLLTLSMAVPVAAQDPAAAPVTRTVTLEMTLTPESRPSSLIPLYVGFAGVQAYDGYTTTRGVRDGARESNYLMGGLAKHPAAFWSVKVGTTAVSIWVAERLWHRHYRTQAVVLMVVANGLMTAVAVRNTQVRAATR